MSSVQVEVGFSKRIKKFILYFFFVLDCCCCFCVVEAFQHIHSSIRTPTVVHTYRHNITTKRSHRITHSRSLRLLVLLHVYLFWHFHPLFFFNLLNNDWISAVNGKTVINRTLIWIHLKQFDCHHHLHLPCEANCFRGKF